MDCVFCKIIAGEIPAVKIFEDDKCLVFLDIKPVSSGHILIIPKEHYPSMTDTPDDLVAYLYIKAKELMPKIKAAIGVDYVSISVVGTEIPHFHIHLIPRRFDDGLAGFWPTGEYGPGEMDAVANKIRAEIKN
jgi:histidine triad (HIT) family protein